jgi:hypothetical protein
MAFGGNSFASENGMQGQNWFALGFIVDLYTVKYFWVVDKKRFYLATINFDTILSEINFRHMKFIYDRNVWFS